jgi:hypothetical protein
VKVLQDTFVVLFRGNHQYDGTRGGGKREEEIKSTKRLWNKLQKLNENQGKDAERGAVVKEGFRTLAQTLRAFIKKRGNF